MKVLLFTLTFTFAYARSFAIGRVRYSVNECEFSITMVQSTGSKLRDGFTCVYVPIYIFGQRTWKLYDSMLALIYLLFVLDMQGKTDMLYALMSFIRNKHS